MEQSPNNAGFVAPVAAGLGALTVLTALVWPLPLHMDAARPISTFGDSHVWVMDRLYRYWTGASELEPTCRAGYPALSTMRPIAQVPAALAAFLRIALGPLAAANVVQLLGLPAAAAAAAALVRRWTGVAPLAAAALGMTWALCPTLLGTFATQEISNTQAWILPLYLLLLDGRGWRGLAAAGLLALAAAFTSPYYALALPLLWGGAALMALVRERERLPRLAGLGTATAAGLWPASAYYDPEPSGGGQSVFQPARRFEALVADVPEPAPVAEPLRLLLESGSGPSDPGAIQHVVYLGLMLVLLAIGLSIWRRRWSGRGLALVLGGAVLSFGPLLAWQGSYTAVGTWLRLPVFWLEELGYPTGLGGMYYRYAVLPALGLVLLVGRGLAGHRAAVPVTLILLSVQVVDGLRVTGPAWPRPLAKVEDAEVLREMVGDDGAVLDLPWQAPGDSEAGQAALLEAALHGRPVAAVPRDPDGIWRPLKFIASDLEARTAPRDLLRRKGIRFVRLTGDDQVPRKEALKRALGEPSHEGAFTLWDVGPTELRCRTPPAPREPR